MYIHYHKYHLHISTKSLQIKNESYHGNSLVKKHKMEFLK